MDRHAIAAMARLAGLKLALVNFAEDVFAAAETADRLRRNLPEPVDPDEPWAPLPTAGDR